MIFTGKPSVVATPIHFSTNKMRWDSSPATLIKCVCKHKMNISNLSLPCFFRSSSRAGREKVIFQRCIKIQQRPLALLSLLSTNRPGIRVQDGGSCILELVRWGLKTLLIWLVPFSKNPRYPFASPLFPGSVQSKVFFSFCLHVCHGPGKSTFRFVDFSLDFVKMS